MKSIRQVGIVNFQSHANTTVEFSPSGHLTVITGNSDSGKTSILRALRWVFFNQPQGTDFIRVGCTIAEVRVTMDDGWSVARLRTPSKNQYIVAHPGGDEQVYEGFGTNVPAEVQQVLGVSPVDVGDIDLKLNIAEQLDGPFLGNSIASSFRAKVLGKLAGTEDVDVANKQLGTDLYRHAMDLRAIEAQLTTKDEQIEELAWVEGLGVTLAQLEVLVQTIKSRQERLRELQGLKAKSDELAGRISRGKEYLDRYRGLDGATDALNEASSKQLQFTSFQTLMQRRCALTDNIEGTLHIYSRYEFADDAAVYIYGTFDKLEAFQTLIRLKRGHDTTVNFVAEYRQHLETLKGVSELSVHLERASAASARLADLNRYHTPHVIIQHELNQARKTMEQLEGIDKVSSMVAGSASSLAKLAQIRKYNSVLSSVRETKEKTLGSLELATHTHENAKKLYYETLNEAGICPTCGAQAHEFKLREVI